MEHASTATVTAGRVRLYRAASHGIDARDRGDWWRRRYSRAVTPVSARNRREKYRGSSKPSAAANAIQEAVDQAAAADTVLGTNGVYDTGGTVRSTEFLTNRVLITKALTLRAVSANAADTVIVGAADRTSGNNGPSAVRRVNIYLSGAVDLDQSPRVSGVAVDMGSYEFYFSQGTAILVN